MTDLEDRIRGDLSDVASHVAIPQRVPRELARSYRRRRGVRIALAAIGSAATVATVATVAATVPRVWGRDGAALQQDRAASDGRSASHDVPAGPLGPRVRAAAAWTGAEVFVWGGAQQGSTRTYADGATYDPLVGSWRPVPRSPISGRAGAVAVPTGDGVLVWGGSDDTPGQATPTDGAVFDPATRMWRRIADAPSGRVFARAFAVAGNVVVVGGETPTGSPADALVYDPAADSWRTIPSTPHVVDAVATATGIVTLSFDPATQVVALTAIDPVAGTTRPLPLPELPASRPQRVGLAWSGHDVVLGVTGRDGTRIAAFDGTSWRVVAEPRGFDLPVRIGFDPATAPLVWTAGRLVSTSEQGVELLDLASGDVSRLHRGDGRTPCGAGAADVWTGTRLFVWGGQSCRVGAGAVSTGVLVQP